MSRLLLVDDDEDNTILVRKCLEGQFQVDCSPSLEDATQKLEKNLYSLILLDVMLPDGDGFQFLARIQNDGSLGDVPVLFFTGKSSTSDQILGYSLGADDYLIKPVDPQILKAKIQAKLKRAQALQEKGNLFGVGNLKLDALKQRAWIENGNSPKTLELTPIEFKLLAYLAHHEEQVFSRNQLIDRIWGQEVTITDRTIDTHVSHVRKKLKDCTHTLDAVHGMGYRLCRRAE